MIRSYRTHGLKMAYVGDGRRKPEAACAADESISLADELDLGRDPARPLAFGPDLAGNAPLRERARSHVERVRMVQHAILIPNLFCVAGAFVLGFTSLSAVITKLGTWDFYPGLPLRLNARIPHRPPWRR